MCLAFHHHTLKCQVWARSSIRLSGLHLRWVFTRQASTSSDLIQNLEWNWQLGKMSIFNEGFGSLMPCLSLTLNVEPWTCERLRNFIFLFLGLRGRAFTFSLVSCEIRICWFIYWIEGKVKWLNGFSTIQILAIIKAFMIMIPSSFLSLPFPWACAVRFCPPHFWEVHR